MDRSNDPKFMEQYLFHAMTFERHVYTWKQALKTANSTLNKIQAQRRNCESGLNTSRRELSGIDETYSFGSQRSKEEHVKEKRGLKKIPAVGLIAIVALVIALLIGITGGPVLGIVIFPAMMILMGLPYFLIYKLYKIYSTKKNNERFTDGKKQHHTVILENDIKNYENALVGIVSKERIATANRDEIAKNLNHAMNVRSQIYSIGVLDKGFQSLEATATLYQYLKTGICTTVKGVGGIYQTYLYHSELGKIVKGIEDIKDRIDDVIRNQHVLYNEVTKANHTLKSIESEVVSINANTREIKNNTEMIAASQRQIADANNYMAYMTWRNQ